MERRLSDNVFKSVPERIAGTLITLAGEQRGRGIGTRDSQVSLTHGQLAALVGTSREIVTKGLGDLADHGLVRLHRGRITLLDIERITAKAGD